MDQRRKQLDDVFRTIVGNGHVYYAPPSNTKLSYPAIVYRPDQIRPTYADNDVYGLRQAYKVTVIDTDPKRPLAYLVANQPRCRHNTSFVKDNLYQDVFTIY